jgi:hypothetical protein
MENYANDSSIPDRSIQKACCIKTEAGSNVNTADVSDHEFHGIKSESDSCVCIADVNNPTNTGTSTMGFSNIDNMDNHTSSCIKTEYANIADMDEHEVPCIKT